MKTREELLEWAKSLPETDEEVEAFTKEMPDNPLPEELADPNRILNKIKLLQLALEREQLVAAALQDLAEVKRTLVANFGPGGQVKPLVEGNERALVMLVKVFDYYVKGDNHAATRPAGD